MKKEKGCIGMYIGIDIGGTKCAVTLGDGEGNIKDKIRFDTGGFDETLENIFNAAEKLGACSVSAIGISCGGPLDSEKGVIMSPPNLPGWDNVPIVKMLEDKFGVPAAIQNDANACALAEHKFGAGKGTKNMVFFTFGTGLGAGLILDGRLYSGTNDMAGEVGHIRLEPHGPVGFGKAGSFEGFCSGNGIAQIGRYKALEYFQCGKKVSYCDSINDLDNITAKKIAECAYSGDELSKEVYKICAEKLGKGIAMLTDVLNPELFVIGSIYGRCRELLEPTVMEIVEKEALDYSRKVCRIVPAGLGEKIGDYAALAVAASIEEKEEKIC